jgi:hypothetical protein
MKIPTNAKHHSESRIKFLFLLPFCSHKVDFLQCTLMARLRKNFLDHSRLSEQLSESLGASKHASEGVTERTFEISK